MKRRVSWMQPGCHLFAMHACNTAIQPTTVPGADAPAGTGAAAPEQLQLARAQAVAFLLYSTGLSGERTLQELLGRREAGCPLIALYPAGLQPISPPCSPPSLPQCGSAGGCGARWHTPPTWAPCSSFRPAFRHGQGWVPACKRMAACGWSESSACCCWVRFMCTCRSCWPTPLLIAHC